MFPRHAADTVSLVFGTIFTAFTVVWVLALNDAIDFRDAFLAVPATLVLAGVVGLVAALRPRAREAEPGRDGDPG